MQELLKKYLDKINEIKEKQYDLGPWEVEFQTEILIRELLKEAGFGEIVDVYLSLNFPEEEQC